MVARKQRRTVVNVSAIQGIEVYPFLGLKYSNYSIIIPTIDNNEIRVRS